MPTLCVTLAPHTHTHRCTHAHNLSLLCPSVSVIPRTTRFLSPTSNRWDRGWGCWGDARCGLCLSITEMSLPLRWPRCSCSPAQHPHCLGPCLATFHPGPVPLARPLAMAPGLHFYSKRSGWRCRTHSTSRHHAEQGNIHTSTHLFPLTTSVALRVTEVFECIPTVLVWHHW